MTNNILTSSQLSQLSLDLSELIIGTKNKIENFARYQTILTYWQIGQRISSEDLTQNANYFSLIIKKLSADLEIDKKTLLRTVQFFRTYPDNPPEESSLTWSHYRQLLTINNANLRLEIEQRAKDENWNSSKTNSEIQGLKNGFDENLGSKIIRPKKANYLYRARIINVVDGDTLLLNIDLGFGVIKEQRIRLAQIDSPEIKSSQGKKSFEYLRDLCARLDFLVVRTNKIDIYGRYVADVFYQNTNDSTQEKTTVFENGVYLNEELVNNGFAGLI
ncbi:MAG: endonuclease YncB(thermonuclease family) [Myxococcota bacterium]|jgi:endonuclease YncB( thermonuclease family)